MSQNNENTSTDIEVEPVAPDNETKSEKFIRLANFRANATIKRIRLLRNLSNTNSYDYNDDQVNKLFLALRKELDDAEAEFKRHTADDPLFSL